jgi:hypothetical protein
MSQRGETVGSELRRKYQSVNNVGPENPATRLPIAGELRNTTERSLHNQRSKAILAANAPVAMTTSISAGASRKRVIAY